jgi:hypothetical protein
MTAAGTLPTMRSWMLSFDLTSVIVFVAAGRSTHDEANTAAAFAHTAAPFLIALVAGWLIMRAWRSADSLTTGAGVLATTVVGGMLLRRLAFDDGTALSFVIVATAFLTLFLIGWRLVARRFAPTA